MGREEGDSFQHHGRQWQRVVGLALHRCEGTSFDAAALELPKLPTQT